MALSLACSKCGEIRGPLSLACNNGCKMYGSLSADTRKNTDDKDNLENCIKRLIAQIGMIGEWPLSLYIYI